MSKAKKKLFVVDVSSWFFRAFYAVRPLSTSSGLPTNAVYGYLQMVSKLLKDHQPEYVAFCHDRKEPSFRKDIDPNYKANREEMPEDLVPQMPYIKKVAPLLGIASFDKEGFEADDLIGTFCEKGRQWGLDVVIVSGDKDFGQLIADDVTMLDTMKSVTYDRFKVMEKWGIEPSQFIDYLAIVGDSSDNVPGVKGVGPKGAQKLLSEYGTLDGIYENLDGIKSKSVRQKLEDSKDSAYLSQKLVTIIKDVELEVELSDLSRQDIDENNLRSFLQELEFQKLEKNLLGISSSSGKNQSSSQKSSKEKPPVVSSQALSALKLDVKKGELEDLQDFIKDGQEYWVVSHHEKDDFLIADDQKGLLVESPSDKIFDFLRQQNFLWKGFAIKETWHQWKVASPKVAWETQLAAYVLRAGDVGEFSNIMGQFLPDVLPQDFFAEENETSLENLLRCQILLEKELRQRLTEAGEEAVFFGLEMPLLPILYAMELRGVALDVVSLQAFSEELSGSIEKLQKEIWDLAEGEFNVASPKQLAEVLFEKMGLPPSKKTKTGYSTNTKVLSALADDYPICRKVLQFREDSKLKSTYVDALPALVREETGRLHTTFNQALTTTGRLSSQNPNLQNIPIRTEKGHRVRQAFVAAEGKKLLSVDYSQVELRILAHIADDSALIRAFEEDLDIHTATAAQIFNLPLADVTTELRRKAKAVNFGIAYGQGAFGLAESLGISRVEAKEIITNYFDKFSGVSKYMAEIVEFAKDKGYVETLLGRRRYIDELKSSNGMVRKFGERAAINAPIQGTASDIIKKAMVDLEGKISSVMILQVHDELIFEGTEKELEKDLPVIRQVMSEAVELKVPLKVSAAIGDNWDEAH